MRKAIVILGVVALLLAALAVPAMAGTEAGINVTVTIRNISVSVDTPSVAYGTIDLNTRKASGVITATNNGNVTENFNIRGANTTNWTLAATNGADQYVHEWATPAYPAEGTDWANNLTTPGYQSLAAGIAAAGTQAFKLQILTPISTTYYTEQSTTVTVQAVAG